MRDVMIIEGDQASRPLRALRQLKTWRLVRDIRPHTSSPRRERIWEIGEDGTRALCIEDARFGVRLFRGRGATT